MAVKIENLTDKPLWLRLNSGASLCVAARGSCSELPKHEVEDNAQLDKLEQRGTITRTAAAGKDGGDKQSRTRRTESAA
jgi:hypothetical protein